MSAEEKVFIESFQSELYVAFQNTGGYFRPRVRRKPITGLKTHFPKFGTAGAAQPKTRKGKVPLLDILRDRIACSVEDRYGADLVDVLDELKTNIAERQAVAAEITKSLARSEDDYALAALMTSTNAANALAANDTYSSDAVWRNMVDTFGANEAFEEGQMFATVSWKGWSELLALNSFINAEYGGDTSLTSAGVRPKVYFGFATAPYSRLTKTTAKNTAIFHHRNTVGVAVGKDPKVEVNYVPENAAHMITGMMSMGSVLLDSTGVVLRQHNS